jgi:hypothetical protein
MQVTRGWVGVASMGLEAAWRARAVVVGGSFHSYPARSRTARTPAFGWSVSLDNPSSARAPFPLRAVTQWVQSAVTELG